MLITSKNNNPVNVNMNDITNTLIHIILTKLTIFAQKNTLVRMEVVYIFTNLFNAFLIDK